MIQQDDPSEQATVELGVGITATLKPFSELRWRATGFFVKKAENSYLITNLHVVTGQSPQISQHRDVDPPQYLVINQWMSGQEDVVALFENGKPVWFESSDVITFEGEAYKIDVVAIPVPTKIAIAPLIFEHVLSSQHTIPRRADDCVVVGYPYHRLRPIWKTAHIAETIQLQPEYFLINGRTKSGMSGSPVFILKFASKTAFLAGIYSGRYDDRGKTEILNDLDIGIVWKIRVIEKLIEAATNCL